MRKMNDEKKNLLQGVDYRCIRFSKYGRYMLILLGWMIAMGANAQLVITPETNAAVLAQTLAGTGVTITNATRAGDINTAGTFTSTNTNLGLSGGVILSTGKVVNAAKPANQFASNSFSGNGDAQLQSLTGGYIYDKAVLEFDIVPQGNVLKFEYVFMSEEYPEWVCSQFNDVFGFFISGQKPGGGNYTNYNIARIPGSNLAVATNAINSGTMGQYGQVANCSDPRGSLAYSSLFRNNLTPVINPDIVYDGMTVVLTATASVIPCRTYHLKLVVGDVGDRIFDSGVMLQANSITSLPVTITSEGELASAGYSSAYEGCVKGKFKFSIPVAQPSDILVNFQVGGTAAPSVDYPAITPLVTIPAGQTSAEISVLATQDNIAEADETITISTVDPCSGNVMSSASMLIKDDIQPTVTVSNSSVCAGQSSQISVTGGVNFSWSPATGLDDANSGTPVASPLNTTTYVANMAWGSCTKTLSTTIHVGGPAISFNTAVAPVICNGASMQVTADAGSGNYNYNWSNGTNSATTTITNAGTYSVTVSDNSGCNSSASLSVGAASLSVTGVASNATCAGGNDGAVNITVNGNNATYNYFWSNNSNTEDISSLAPGNYDVTVTNAEGCIATRSFTVAQAANSINASVSAINPSCFGSTNGSISLSVTGGTQPYTYNWGSSVTTQNRSNLAAGTYNVTIADAGGCSTVKSVTLTQAPALTVTAQRTNANCATGVAGTISLTVAGGTSGYSYLWNDNNTDQNRTGLQAGAYSVVVSDANGCSVSVNSSVSGSGTISANFNYTGTYCAPGAAVNFTSTGTQNGVNHAWTFETNASSTQSSPSYTYTNAGSYTVTHTVSNAVCSNTVSKVVSVKAQPIITPTVTQIACNGEGDGAIALNVTSGMPPYNYNWGNGVTTQNRTGLGVGNYSVVVTDGNNCSATFAASIVESSAINVSETHTDVSCYNGTNGRVDITAIGGILPYSYRWSNGALEEDLNNVGAAQYIVTVTDANDCSVEAAVDIVQPAQLSVAIEKTDITCHGDATGSLNAIATGGTPPFMYAWASGTTQRIENLVAGAYTVSVTDASGCIIQANAIVAQASEVVMSNTIAQPTCFGSGDGSIMLNATGGAGGYTYTINNTAIQQGVNGLQAGAYVVKVRDANGCQKIEEVILTAPAAMEITADIKNEQCGVVNTGSVTVSVTGGNAPYTYVWSNNNAGASLNNAAQGTYVVTVTDAKGCRQSKANVVHASEQLKVRTTANVLPCNVAKGEASISVLNGIAPYSFEWSNGTTTANLSNVLPGNYSVTIRDAGNCELDTVIAIVNDNSFVVQVEGAGFIELGETVDLNAVSNGGTDVAYTWVPAYGLQCPTCASVSVRPSETSTYKVTAIDGVYGCVATAEATVQVGTDNTVFIPNAFTPNGDGQNDVLQLYGNLQGIRYFQLLIFNRWGEKVYETNDQFFEWDAIYKGEKLEPASFLYVMKVVHLNNETSRTFKGSITLLK